MRRTLTLSGAGRVGEVVWDDEAGTFQGTDAVDLALCAQGPQSHPAWPSTDALPAKDARALIVLLHCFGWDVPPELADEAAEWLKGQEPLPADAVV